MIKQKKKNFLVALLKNESDLKYVLEDGWYRIPVSTKLVPKMVKENYIKYIAFYHNRTFRKDPTVIKYYAKVKNVGKAKKKNLLPWTVNDARGENEYFVLKLGDINILERPIESKRKRRLLFITTTLKQFKHAEEINDLFVESYLEEKLWKILRKELIEAERQYYLQVSDKSYVLDFALFCRERNLNIECDGDEFHMLPGNVKKDKSRDNDLASSGWSVLRYDYKEVTRNSEKVLGQIKETINSYGGLENSRKPFSYKYFDKEKGEIELD